MSFADAGRHKRATPIVAVAAIHGLIAYAFISGLAYKVIPYIDVPLVARDIRDDAAPPPKAQPLPPPRAIERRTEAARDTIIVVPNLDGGPLVQPDLGPTVTAGSSVERSPVAPPPPVSQARAATVVGARASWVTTDDYPAQALRAEAQGIVGISVAIDAAGRVTGCEVTASSGNATLDEATCRTYARRARFTPALDEAGHPTASRRADRVRWQMPAD